MAPGAPREPKGSKEGKGQSSLGAIRTRGSFVYRGEFRQNIENMMYAFGDVAKPDADSLALMEDMTVSFLVDLIHRARPNPQKIPIPSNQNIINTIAAAALSQDATPIDPSTTSSTSNRRSAQSTDRSKGVNTALSNAKSTLQMPPRLAAHPYVARPRLTVEDLKFACRKDTKLSSRIEELLYLDKVIQSARKAFDNPEEDVAAGQTAS